MVEIQDEFKKATIQTQQDLKQTALDIAQHLEDSELSKLSLAEIEAIVGSVAQMVPAGNVPGLILNGLSRFRGNTSNTNVKRDIGMLFRGAAVYGAFFAGPAAVIWGYQQLLKLAGKNPDEAFPDGTWQFYVNYALREDTARHANETHGFDSALHEHGINLDDVDRITAWVMTAIYTVHQYEDLLRNEWRERMYPRLLLELDDSEEHQNKFGKVFQIWQAEHLPYRRKPDARSNESYPAYRSRKFDEFFINYLEQLTPPQRRTWLQRVNQAKDENLTAYYRQMSIQGYLKPEPLREDFIPVELEKIHIGVIHNGRYYLVPACKRGTTQPPDVDTVRQQVAAFIVHPAEHGRSDLRALARVERNKLHEVYKTLSPDFVQLVGMLNLTPILLNFDPVAAQKPLAEIRQAERGVGNHAMTIFDTRKTFVFDQSHIFYDGTWGVALSEIMTNDALSWAAYLAHQSPARPGNERPYSPNLDLNQATLDRIQNDYQMVSAIETTAENREIHLKSLLSLRRLFKQRSDLLGLTVNDILLLLRAIHAATYEPDKALVDELRRLQNDPYARSAAEAALQSIKEQYSPAILIPVDASRNSPRDRLYPMTFEVPLAELDLLNLHQQVITALDAYNRGGDNGETGDPYKRFDTLQRNYLTALAGFGQVMSQAKAIGNRGESASVGSIKLLAHMPGPLQALLDNVPSRFDVLNDIIKGREVFSNVGQVVSSSTLTRFITAKDDNEKKTLAWGIITDADGTIIVSLRDFRPHVKLLVKCGHRDVARRITEHYLNSYVDTVNQYVKDWYRITVKSRETRMAKW